MTQRRRRVQLAISALLTVVATLFVLGVQPAQARYWPPYIEDSVACEDGGDPLVVTSDCPFKVNFGEVLQEAMWFEATTIAGTASAGTDYIPWDHVRVTAPAGASYVVVNVKIYNDRVCEPPEKFTLTLSGGSLGRDVATRQRIIEDALC